MLRSCIDRYSIQQQPESTIVHESSSPQLASDLHPGCLIYRVYLSRYVSKYLFARAWVPISLIKCYLQTTDYCYYCFVHHCIISAPR